MKKILVAVTGMSPQIVTETVYALYKQHAWIPDEIFVLTTQTGRQKLESSLLGENGFFRRLQQDYDLPHIDFDISRIRVIQDSDGLDLADIRTPEQNNLAADMIVRFIHDLCADDDAELHVSIAGGRKSMGFYIGYALSLFGRRQDKLSHVLVEAAFENNREFFYPPKSPLLLNTDMGMKDASQAEVMLAEIPFVRMREGMPKLKLGDGWNFSQAVELTQAGLYRSRLKIMPKECSVACGDGKPFKLPPQHFAVYWAMALLRQSLLSVRVGRQHNLAEFYQHFSRCYCTIRRPHGSDMVAEWDKLEESERWEEMKNLLRESISRIKTRLKQEVGIFAEHYEITGGGARNNKEYYLSVPADCIEIVE